MNFVTNTLTALGCLLCLGAIVALIWRHSATAFRFRIAAWTTGVVALLVAYTFAQPKGEWIAYAIGVLAIAGFLVADMLARQRRGSV